jgi:hypothetical protein
MVERACFPQGARFSGSVTEILCWLALNRKGELIVQDEDRVVIGDDAGEKAISLRLRPDHLLAIDALASDLKKSRRESGSEGIGESAPTWRLPHEPNSPTPQ